MNQFVTNDIHRDTGRQLSLTQIQHFLPNILKYEIGPFI